MVKKYAVIDDATGKCVNLILWDGESKWVPPVGCSVVLAANIEIHKDLMPAPIVDAVLEKRIADLETFTKG